MNEWNMIAIASCPLIEHGTPAGFPASGSSHTNLTGIDTERPRARDRHHVLPAHRGGRVVAVTRLPNGTLERVMPRANSVGQALLVRRHTKSHGCVVRWTNRSEFNALSEDLSAILVRIDYVLGGDVWCSSGTMYS